MRLVFIYDAFSGEKFGGNQAGIVLESEGMEREEKQNIAKELGFSETVFISRSEKADWKFEYFTPKQEVDLCGHATIAAIYALFDERKIADKDTVMIETRLGNFQISLQKQGNHLASVWMEQDQGDISYDILGKEEEIRRALGLEEKDIREDIKMVKAYSGLWDLMIPLASKQALDRMRIDFSKVEELSEELGVISFHPFYLEGKEAYVRNFAPIVDILEEAATGTSNGALAFYLQQIGFLQEEEELICHQGESMDRKSQILAKIDSNGKIRVGGQAVAVFKGVFV